MFVQTASTTALLIKSQCNDANCSRAFHPHSLQGPLISHQKYQCTGHAVHLFGDFFDMAFFCFKLCFDVVVCTSQPLSWSTVMLVTSSWADRQSNTVARCRLKVGSWKLQNQFGNAVEVVGVKPLAEVGLNLTLFVLAWLICVLCTKPLIKHIPGKIR